MTFFYFNRSDLDMTLGKIAHEIFYKAFLNKEIENLNLKFLIDKIFLKNKIIKNLKKIKFF